MLKEKLSRLPAQSGVYILKDQVGEVLYVGKAKSLRSRVRSYFQKGVASPKTRMLQERIGDFEVYITSNEVEAMILESNLIKKHQPPFNIRLKDDKTYPYLKVTLQEGFPRIIKTRQFRRDGARYFGPYTSVEAVNRTLKWLLRLFPLRTCKRKITAGEKWERACLNYHIKKCLGPCIGAVDPQEYRQWVEKVILFLEGKQEELLEQVENNMQKAALNQEYEQAAEYRDALLAMEKVRERQEVVWKGDEEKDILGLAREGDRSCIQVFQIRHGRLLGREHFFLEGTGERTSGEIVTAFMQQYYLGSRGAPREIILPEAPEERELIENWLNKEAEHRVVLTVPQKGKKFRLLKLARENAEYQLEQENLMEEEKRKKEEKDLKQLKNALGLETFPEIIEGYDISNIGGEEAVGSMVVFVHGRPAGERYRRYKIRTVEGSNDVAMMGEVLERRLERLKNGGGTTPDLILIDGGKGQVNRVHSVLEKFNFEEIPLIGLAKKEEEIVFPGQKEGLRLDLGNRGLQLLQKVRDEAHRFALGYHRRLRLRSMTHSLLEDIPGIGPKKRKALLDHFGSLAALRQANVRELSKVPGINKKTGERIRDWFQENLQS